MPNDRVARASQLSESCGQSGEKVQSDDSYGPENPTRTPPGARTTAIVTPSIIRVGGIIGSAPSVNACAYASCVSATCTVKLLPGDSAGSSPRIPPPPFSE